MVIHNFCRAFEKKYGEVLSDSEDKIFRMEKFGEGMEGVSRKEKIVHAVPQELLRKHHVLGPEVVPLPISPKQQVPSMETMDSLDENKRDTSAPSSFFLLVITFVAVVLLLRFLAFAFR